MIINEHCLHMHLSLEQKCYIKIFLGDNCLRLLSLIIAVFTKSLEILVLTFNI